MNVKLHAKRLRIVLLQLNKRVDRRMLAATGACKPNGIDGLIKVRTRPRCVAQPQIRFRSYKIFPDHMANFIRFLALVLGTLAQQFLHSKLVFKFANFLRRFNMTARLAQGSKQQQIN